MFVFSPKSTIATSGPAEPGSPNSTIAAGDTCPTKSWSSQRGTADALRGRRIPVQGARLQDHPTEAPMRPQVTGEGPRVHPRDRGDAGVAEERGQLARIVEDGRRGVRDDEAAEPRTERLVIGERAARSCR